ncbi:helix-turn-helix transcriptional regulator [Virgibacillus halophilus]|uniref:helix-turn-helix transcriptional regulator n=1 Tax=Tigheibacillus halophilus TaxID=361280 RepID=UPI0036393660
MQRKSTKQKLMDVLKKEEKALTLEAIMTHFTISDAAVRKHLHELENQSIVRRNAVKQKLGRPFFTYELTKRGHGMYPNQYEHLPVELLQDLEELQGSQAVDALLKKRMEREKDFYDKAMTAHEEAGRIAEIAELLSEKGYMVELETRHGGEYIMKNFHCPIANLAVNYQQVCHNEQEMYAALFPDFDIVSHQCITDGDSQCKWIFKKKAAPQLMP